MFSTYASIQGLKRVFADGTAYMWNFEPAFISGTTVSSCIGNNNLILSNSAALSTSSPLIGTQYFYPNTSAFYSGLATLSTPISTSNGISVSFWFRSVVVGSGIRTLIGMSSTAAWGGGGSTWFVHLANGSTTVFENFVNGSYYNSPAQTILDATWKHMCIVYYGSNFKMYYNGNLTPIVNATTAAQPATYTYIGINRRGDATEVGVFALDNIRIFPFALSAAQAVGYSTNTR